ncbi:MAG TPA: DMT family transporter [Candidatus Paenalcaligenes intestinipullorum]|uniref:DMT family transporter n=1 Tax=Candidatus Paenalcaligenes intestinipullorum TaxID=2838718 RepID=A0A9D2RLQ7_9BURK|nr:DMT family transporter [Candidatus Paenalcaligenes intestinipullorum]
MQSLWMLVACAMFALMGAGIKFAAQQDANLAQIILFRGLPSVLVLFCWARFTKHRLRPPSWRVHILRNVFGVTSMWLGFFSLTVLSLPTSISLTYTAPLFIGVWMLLYGGAQRDWIRVLAVFIGFAGVVAILRPSVGAGQELAAGVAILAGACSAVAMLQIRQLGKLGEPEWRTVFLFSSFVCLSSSLGFWNSGWQALTWQGWLALTGVGLTGLFGQLTMTRAFGAGSTLLTAALQYTTIVFAALLGWLFWEDLPPSLAWLGIAMIIGSGMLSLWRTYQEGKIIKGHVAQPARPKA